MGEITDTAILAALGRQMTVAVAKQSAAASNLANLSTPGYRARDVQFSDALERQMQGGTALVASRSGARSTSEGSVGEIVEVEGLPARRDGNNVQLDRELLQMNRAAGEFTAAQTAMGAKFRLLRYAINEGH